MVVGPQLVHEQAQRLLHQGQLVRLVHRARHIEQKDQVRGRTLRIADLTALETDPHEAVFGRPRGRGHLEVRGEGHVARRRRVAVGEIVHEFLDPHGIGRRPLPLGQEAPDIGVRCRVHVHREGGERLIRHTQVGVVFPESVPLGIGLRLYGRLLSFHHLRCPEIELRSRDSGASHGRSGDITTLVRLGVD